MTQLHEQPRADRLDGSHGRGFPAVEADVRREGVDMGEMDLHSSDVGCPIESDRGPATRDNLTARDVPDEARALVAAGDRSTLVQRFFLCRTRIVSLLTDMDECFQAAAPAPVEARPEAAGDRVDAGLDGWYLGGTLALEWRSEEPAILAELRSRMRSALASADAVASPPAVPDEVRRLSEAATPGEWRRDPDARPDDHNADFICACVNFVRSLLAAPAQPASTSVVPDGVLSADKKVASLISLGAPAQPPVVPDEDAERIARIERCRVVLAERNRRIRELEEALQALSGKKGPAVLEMMIAERDRRIHELERERDDLERDLKKERHDTDFLIENLKAADITIEPAQGGIYIRNAAEGILRQTEREVAIWASVLRDQATEIERLRQRCAELEQNHE